MGSLVLKELSQLAKLLADLDKQAALYDQHNKIPKLKNKPFFVAMLFKTQSSELIDYVQESRDLLLHIKEGIDKNSSKTLIEFQCNKLVEQCQAIKKTLSSENQRFNNYQQDQSDKAKYFANKQKKAASGFSWLTQRVINSSRELYNELSKHHGYRQKLTEKINQLNGQLAHCQAQDKIAMQQKILHQHKRLGQCNKAIYFIEQKIAQLESGKFKR